MLVVVAAPESEPVTPEQARLQCRAEYGEEFELLDGYVVAARELVEAETGRALITQEWEMSLDELPCSIVIPKPPTLSITSIKYIDTDGVEQTLPTDQYQLLRRGEGDFEVVPAYGVTWPTPRDQRACVKVRFVAGYGADGDAVPATLKQAILLLASHWFANREAVSAKGTEKEIPIGVERLLFPHRLLC